MRTPHRASSGALENCFLARAAEPPSTRHAREAACSTRLTERLGDENSPLDVPISRADCAVLTDEVPVSPRITFGVQERLARPSNGTAHEELCRCWAGSSLGGGSGGDGLNHILCVGDLDLAGLGRLGDGDGEG